MKKVFFLALLMILVGGALHAQDEKVGDRFYGRVGIGGGVGLCYYDPCDYYNEDYYYPNYDNYKSVGFTPGKGFDVDLAAGYRFNKHLGVELGLRDLFGLNIKTTITSNNEGTSFSEVIKTRGMMFQVIPSFVLNAGFEKFDPYARFGLIIGAMPRIYTTETETNGSDVSDYSGVYKGGIPLGFSAALGVNFHISDHINLYGEFDCNGINYTPKKYLMTKYTLNGVDHLGDLTTKQKETTFVSKYDALENIPDSDPNKALKQSFPFSNFELNIGFSYRF